MGSKLTVLAAVVALSSTAYADKAADELKKGIDFYKAGKYAEAVPHLEQAQKLAPKPDTLFALAQAQRLSGDCNAAAASYHKVIEQVSDMNVGKLVAQNLALCEQDEPRKPEPKAEPKEDAAPPPEPKIVEKTVYRDTGKTDKLAAAMFGGGMLALGAAGGFYFAASGNADAADRAKSLEDHDLLSDRASTQRVIMYVAGGAGLAMMGVAIFRWTRGGGESAKADVAVVPASGGGSVFVTSRF